MKFSVNIIAFILPILIFPNEVEKNKILNILADYNYDFIKADYDAIIDYFSLPASIHLQEETINTNNPRQLKSAYKKIRKGLPDYYSHSDWKKMDVKILNNEIAIANTMFSRYKKNGEVYFTGAALYYFRKINNQWKILSVTPYKPYNYFDLN
tara:strand:- start:1360 stop:1818 length:459 start_codon:yes stop_codon:yes gene_type:complete